jgi:hypothetical protein
MGEECPEHLPDHVCRNNTVDPETGGKHGRDRGLADPRGPAQQHDERAVEAVEAAPVCVAAHGLLALLGEEHILCQLM